MIDLNYLRANLTFSIKKHLTTKIFLNPNIKWLEQKFKETKKFIKDNSALHISNSDKGNVILIMNKNFYQDRISQLLNDDTTYDKIKNPTASIQTKLNNIIDDWCFTSGIDDRTRFYLQS